VPGQVEADHLRQVSRYEASTSHSQRTPGFAPLQYLRPGQQMVFVGLCLDEAQETGIIHR